MDSFSQRKKDVLSKEDKSSKGSWDKRILKLCEKINDSDGYYTTSSCAGRGVLMFDRNKKEEGLFVRVWHDLMKIEELEEAVEELQGNVKFKLDPPIIHVACADIGAAQKLYDKAKLAGFKRSGLVAFGKNFVLEINGTEKLEFPVIRNGKILVDESFLKEIVSASNFKLEKGWKKIEKLLKLLE